MGHIGNNGFLAGYRAGAAAGVIRCHDCVYRWRLSDDGQSREASTNEQFCFKHNRMTAASYFCGDAKK